MITSVQNPQVKAVRKLLEPKWRRREGRFLLEGTALLEEAEKVGWPVEAVYATSRWVEREWEKVRARQGTIPTRDVERLTDGLPAPTEVADHVMAAMSTLDAPEGVVAVGRLPGEAALPTVQAWSLWLIADAIQDPGNLGAIIRTADAAGADAVILGPGTADAFAPRTVRASMGSVLHLPVVSVMDLEAVHADTHREGMRWLALAPRGGKSLYETDLRGPVAIRVGNEAAGLSEEALAQADLTVRIPMPGQAESLNAAASAAVVMYEAVRQRLAAR